MTGYRGHMPFERVEVGEEMHHCGHCGERTVLDEGLEYATGDMQSTCPGCKQRYVLTSEEDIDAYDPADPGEIEVVDEMSGAVVGTTAAPRPGCTVPELDELLAQLKDEPQFEPSEMAMKEASQGDLNHLFGIRPAPPSPYGDDFGSFG